MISKKFDQVRGLLTTDQGNEINNETRWDTCTKYIIAYTIDLLMYVDLIRSKIFNVFFLSAGISGIFFIDIMQLHFDLFQTKTSSAGGIRDEPS